MSTRSRSRRSPPLEIERVKKVVARYHSTREAANALGCSPASLLRFCRHHGIKIEYGREKDGSQRRLNQTLAAERLENVSRLFCKNEYGAKILGLSIAEYEDQCEKLGVVTSKQRNQPDRP